MDFIEIKPYDEDSCTSCTYWISGIYKIVSYEPGEYYAFYIPDHFYNWGNFVSQPPHLGKHGHVWNSFDAAVNSCIAHADCHKPKDKTVKRAAEILQGYLAA